ncbi:MAG: cytochrome b N-terminal domain-containing protein [Pyrinomonadaceae bacterium]
MPINEFADRAFRRLFENTQLLVIAQRVSDPPSTKIINWLRTTAGLVVLLLVVQFATGVLMAFHYVPTVQNAHTTVDYIEKVVAYGSWIRSLHYHSSILLPIALLAHILQIAFRAGFKSNPASWVLGIILLGLVLAAAATGYALPWDARAFNGVNVAVSLAGFTPLVGKSLQAWLQGGATISTVTVSRFFGLHAFVIPTVIVSAIVFRVFIAGGNRSKPEVSVGWIESQLFRNAVSMGVFFACLAIYSFYNLAPFGPKVENAEVYIPRPGPQFIWLFELQKYFDGTAAGLIAFGAPTLIFGLLIVVPLLLGVRGKRIVAARYACLSIAGFGIFAVATLTAASIYQDRTDAATAKRLAEQEHEEAKERKRPFKPQVVRLGNIESQTNAIPGTEKSANIVPVPSSYTESCAKCHGSNGEGTRKYPPLTGVTTRQEDALSNESLLEIIDDAEAYGLGSKMPPFKDKLTADQKQEIIKYIRALK